MHELPNRVLLPQLRCPLSQLCCLFLNESHGDGADSIRGKDWRSAIQAERVESVNRDSNSLLPKNRAQIQPSASPLLPKYPEIALSGWPTSVQSSNLASTETRGRGASRSAGEKSY